MGFDNPSGFFKAIGGTGMFIEGIEAQPLDHEEFSTVLREVYGPDLPESLPLGLAAIYQRVAIVERNRERTFDLAGVLKQIKEDAVGALAAEVQRLEELLGTAREAQRRPRGYAKRTLAPPPKSLDRPSVTNSYIYYVIIIS